jgi:competence ComEA-like helix-hairpin-helix protein
MNYITSWLRNYFGFSQTEIKGFMSLSIIMLLVLSVTCYVKFFHKTNNYTSEVAEEDRIILQKWVEEINEHQRLYAEQNPKPNYENKYANKYDSNKYDNKYHKYENNYDKKDNATQKYTLFNFNPNTATTEELQNLGIAKFLAQRIVNYREKGGKFRVKADFKKMYGLSEEKFDELEDFIELPDKQEDNKKNFENATKNSNTNFPITAPTSNYAPKKPVKFDFNNADTAQLKNIRGIGTVLAERIVKFRNSVGGFHSAEQLKEIYGLQPEVIDELLKYAIWDKNFTKINVNTADEAQLKSHAYIGYKVAGVLIAYRKQHGNFKTADDLLKIRVLDSQKLEKLKPYLEF